MIKNILSFSIAALILCIGTSQTAKPSQNKPINTDSIPIISKADVINFNQLLKTGATYDQYTKLSPEATLIALLNWKTEQLGLPKKQVQDTTKKK